MPLTNLDIVWVVLYRLNTPDRAALEYALRIKRPDNLEILPVSLRNVDLFLFWQREGYARWTDEWIGLFHHFRIDETLKPVAYSLPQKPQPFIKKALERGDVAEAKYLIHNVHYPIYRFDDRASLTFALNERPEWMIHLAMSIEMHGTPEQYEKFRRRFPDVEIFYPRCFYHVDQAVYWMGGGTNVAVEARRIISACIEMSPSVLAYFLDNGLTFGDWRELEIILTKLGDKCERDVPLMDRIVGMCRFMGDNLTQALLNVASLWKSGMIDRYVRLSIHDTDPGKLEIKSHHCVCHGCFVPLSASKVVFLRDHVRMNMHLFPFADIMEEISQCDPDEIIDHKHGFHYLIKGSNLRVLQLLERRGVRCRFLYWCDILRSKNMECIRFLAGQHHKTDNIFYALQEIGKNDLWEHVEELLTLMLDVNSERLREELFTFPTAKITRAHRIHLARINERMMRC